MAEFEVAITGVSGAFPESEGLEELERNLLDKINLVTTDDRRWTPGELNVPAGIGKVKNPHTFDMTFFGIHRKLCEIMDPHTRLCLEHAYAAVCDAGINPIELSGTKTPVIMGSVISETEYECVVGAKNVGHAMLGHSRTMQANRISYFMNLKGPSLALDCTWNAGIQVLEIGYNMIKSGQATAALVGVCSLISKPEVSTHFLAKGELNRDGATKSFSADADGYSRSEGCVCFFLQRKDHAKRLYGSILGIKSNVYGSRNVGFTEFEQKKYQEMLEELYREAKVEKKDVAYVEANGCASKKIDAMELNALAEVFCSKRDKPLPIGCIKSNLGHTEASSSLVAVCKGLLALRSGVIPPNINYSAPNPNVPALLSGELKVVTEPTKLEGDIVGISCSGIPGAYGHILIKGNPKVKAKPLVKGELPPDGLPRLVVISGREENALNGVISKLESSPIDEEFISLTQTLFSKEIKNHLFRGYTVLGDGTKNYHQIKSFDSGSKRPVWFVFSGMGSQWCGMGTVLLKLPTFAKAIQRCHEVLKPEGVDVYNIVTSEDIYMFENILHSFVGIAAIQIGLVDVLKELGIEPDGIVGHSVGELGCAYADGCFTLEQMILSAYARGRASIETKLIKGKMAAVGLGYQRIKNQLPPTIEVACHNSAESCTLSGPSDDMEAYIEELKGKGVFAKLVNVSNIAYHSKHIKPAAPALLKYLKKVIPDPKPRSKRWISSSIPQDQWDSELACYSSAEYHTNNLLNSVLFEEASSHIPDNAIVIEIAPHGLLQAILKKSLSTCSNIPLTSRFESDSISFLLTAIGKLYLEGIDVDLARLYPKVEFPVSRDTAYVSPIITWDHAEQWIIWSFFNRSDLQSLPCWKFEKISLAEEKFEIFSQNKINGKMIIPGSACVNLIVEMFNDINKNETSPPIKIENLKFSKFVEVPSKGHKELYFLLQKGSGDFEICEENDQITSGTINVIDDITHLNNNVSFEIDNSFITMEKEEFYKYLNHMNIEQGDAFQTVQKIEFNENSLCATVQWKGQWVPFLNSVLMAVSFFEMNTSNIQKLVGEIKQMSLCFDSFPVNQTKDIKVYYNYVTKTLKCEGMEMLYPLVKDSTIPLKEANISMEQFKFIPYTNPPIKTIRDVMSISANAVHENINRFKEGGVSQLNIIDIQGKGFFTESIKYVKEQGPVEVLIKQCDSDGTISSFDWSDLNKESVWVISDCINYKKTIKLLKNSKQGFLLTRVNEDILKCAQESKLQSIFQFNLGNDKIVLYTTNKPSDGKKNIMNLTENWLNDLQITLNIEASKETPGITYLIGRLTFLSEIQDIIKECAILDNSDLLRLYFIDEKCPPFDFKNSFYTGQIEKDVKINICINNVWGNLSLVSIENKPKKSLEFFGKSVYQLSSIKAEGVELTTVGLNLEDVTGYSNCSKLGVLEYCGYNQNKEKVFGLSSIEDGNILIPDKTLVWKKPSNWSDEDAVSVPLFYSMAYHMIFSYNEMVMYDSILVHRGSLPISQAVITVALFEGFNIFVTYQNEEEKKFIMEQFPEIEKDNIISCKNANFYLHVMTKTKGKGVHIAVNTLSSNEMVVASQKCLGKQSSYFQISLAPMENQATMGMRIFINESIVSGMLPETVLLFSEPLKEKIRKLVEQGLKQGVLKPFKVKKLSNDLLNTTAISLMKSTGNINKKMIVVLNNKQANNSEVFLCESDKTYLILGGQQGIWLEMVDWLVTRGAKSINVILKNHVLSSFAAQRLNAIMNNYPAVKISLMSSKRISSPANIENLYNEINSNEELAAAFIIGNGMRDKIVTIDQILSDKKSKCQIICIGEGGETVCERRRHNKLPGVSICCSSNLDPRYIMPNLDWLTSKSNELPVVVLKESKDFSVNDIESRNLSYKNHMPETVKELLDFQKLKSNKGGFVEMKTASPLYQYAKEIPPVFLFSGLKPNQLNKLASKLFYPAFSAVLPPVFKSIDSVAVELCESLCKFPHNVFTLIADDWGGALALSVAKLLEAKEKYVSVIMLDAAPQTVQEWVKTIYDSNGLKMIYKYLKVDPKIKKTLALTPKFNDVLESVLANSKFEIEEEEKIKEAIIMLKCRLDAIIKLSGSDTKVIGKCHLIRPDGSSESDQCQLQAYCKRTVKIHILDEVSHKEMLSSDKVARIINGFVLFEHRDAANKPDQELMGVNITLDIKHKSDGLMRA